MLAEFLSIIDRLIALRTIQTKRTEERFDNVIEPVFDELSVVHGDYVKMFTVARTSLNTEPNLSNRRLIKKVESAKSLLVENRLQFIALREKLVAVQSELKTAEYLTDLEQQFFATVGWYLIVSQPGARNQSTAASESIDLFQRFIDRLDWKKDVADKDQEERLQYAEAPSDALLMLQHELDAIVDDQKTQWRQVCSLYSRLYSERHSPK